MVFGIFRRRNGFAIYLNSVPRPNIYVSYRHISLSLCRFNEFRLAQGKKLNSEMESAVSSRLRLYVVQRDFPEAADTIRVIQIRICSSPHSNSASLHVHHAPKAA
jgi:hypothetical protein